MDKLIFRVYDYHYSIIYNNGALLDLMTIELDLIISIQSHQRYKLTIPFPFHFFPIFFIGCIPYLCLSCHSIFPFSYFLIAFIYSFSLPVSYISLNNTWINLLLFLLDWKRAVWVIRNTWLKRKRQCVIYSS